MDIFVFGSNLAGHHGAGAALTAKKNHGAQQGVGVGRTGDSYAIPTKDWALIPLDLQEIAGYVDNFLIYAKENPELNFYVTRVGCGFAGYKDEDIAPFFKGAPKNCKLPREWVNEASC